MNERNWTGVDFDEQHGASRSARTSNATLVPRPAIQRQAVRAKVEQDVVLASYDAWTVTRFLDVSLTTTAVRGQDDSLTRWQDRSSVNKYIHLASCLEHIAGGCPVIPFTSGLPQESEDIPFPQIISWCCVTGRLRFCGLSNGFLLF